MRKGVVVVVASSVTALGGLIARFIYRKKVNGGKLKENRNNDITMNQILDNQRKLLAVCQEQNEIVGETITLINELKRQLDEPELLEKPVEKDICIKGVGVVK